MSKRNIGFWSATSIVVANMIGTGVFTSLGYQIIDIHQGFPVLMLWVIGGFVALLGAISYAELACRLPEDGGEFYFLSKIFHPSVGYMAGFASSTVGFTAPVAGAALALGAYLKGVVPWVSPKEIAAAVIIIITAIHAWNANYGLWFQKISTAAKVTIIIVFIGFGIAAISTLPSPTFNGVSVNSDYGISDIWDGFWLAPAFSVGLVWVSFAYSGWNASAYFAGSVKNPQKTLTRSIILGTVLVTILYVLLNYVFMNSSDWENLVFKKEVGLIAAQSLFGLKWGKIMGGIISILLISTISSMVFTGPRVLKSMAEKMGVFKSLSKVNKSNSPSNALIFQGLLSIVFLYTLSFESLIYYVAFTLSIFTLLTVVGMMKLRITNGKPLTYRAWGYPITPLIFIIITALVAWYFIIEHPTESIIGIITSLLGLVLYFFADNKEI